MSTYSTQSGTLDEQKTKLYRWILIGTSVLGILGLSVYFVSSSYNSIHDTIEMRETQKLAGIVNTLATQIDGDAYEQLLQAHPKKDGIRKTGDHATYQQIHQMLVQATKANGLNSDVYTLSRPLGQKNTSSSSSLEFIVTSSNSPYFRHPYQAPAELIQQISTGGILHSYRTENGSWVSAFSPIHNSKGNVVGVLEADTKLDDILKAANKEFFQSLIGIGIFTLLAMAVVAFLAYRITENILKEQRGINDRYKEVNKTFDVLSGFASEIGEGNFENNLEEIESQQNDLAKSLLVMRENLNQSKEEELQRNWSVQGVAEFGEILRNNNSDLGALSNEIISHLVKYMKANQGGIFIRNTEGHSEEVLELTGAYAYQRKKYLHKEIKKGEGLVGQCWIEGERIYMTELPNDYVNITSGLGDASPRALLIVPLKINDEFYGVLELASFRTFAPYEIEFVVRVGESIASTISMVKVNEKTADLLTESQELAHQLQAQEEELRQNQEEMLATQEEMDRKIKDLETKLKKQEKEEDVSRLNYSEEGE